MLGQIEDIDRTVEWYVREQRYGLKYTLTQIFAEALPTILQDPKIYSCVQSSIRSGKTYAESMNECEKLYVEGGEPMPDSQNNQNDSNTINKVKDFVVQHPIIIVTGVLIVLSQVLKGPGPEHEV